MSGNRDRECSLNEAGVDSIRETLASHHRDYAGFNPDTIPDHLVQRYVAEAENNAWGGYGLQPHETTDGRIVATCVGRGGLEWAVPLASSAAFRKMAERTKIPMLKRRFAEIQQGTGG